MSTPLPFIVSFDGAIVAGFVLRSDANAYGMFYARGRAFKVIDAEAPPQGAAPPESWTIRDCVVAPEGLATAADLIATVAADMNKRIAALEAWAETVAAPVTKPAKRRRK